MARVIPIYESFTFNGKNSLDFGVRISGGGTYGTPQRDITTIEVLGRNGELTQDNGRFKNIQIEYPSWIARDIEPKLTEFTSFLNSSAGYHRLEDSYHPEYYRMARFASTINPTVMYNEAGEFTIEFDCMPQKWLKSGENAVTVTDTTVLFNPTAFDAQPLIKVTGVGQFTINDVVTKITTNPDGLYIDCENMTCYKDAVNKSKYVQFLTRDGEYPTLKAGENKIAVNGTTLEIIPRWWKI